MKFILFLAFVIAVCYAQNTTTAVNNPSPQPAVNVECNCPVCPTINVSSGMSLSEFQAIFIPIGLVGAVSAFLVLVFNAYKKWKSTGKVSIDPVDMAHLIQETSAAVVNMQEQKKQMTKEKRKEKEYKKRNKNEDSE